MANLSSYTNRYDKFSIVVGSLETGSYRYEVYDTSSTVSAATAVVETGLAYVQVVLLTFNTFVDAGFSVEETQAALKDLMGKRGSVLDAAPEPPADPNAKYRAEFAQHKHLLSVSEDQYIRSRRIDDGLEHLQK